MKVEASPNVMVDSFSDVVTGVVVVLEFVVPVSYLLSGVAVEALIISIGVWVLAGANTNVSAAVMTALEFSISTP